MMWWFFFSSRRRHTRCSRDWSSDVCSSDLLLGFPYAYTIAVAPPYASNGAHIGPAAINRNDVNAYIEDTWKISPEWTLEYGLRYEFYTRSEEHTSELQSRLHLVCRLLLENKKRTI